MAEEKVTTRERAERAVEKQLEKILQRASFTEEHIANARETLRLRVASEEIGTITETLFDLYMPEDLRALTEGNMREFIAAEPRRWASAPPTGEVSLTDDLFAFRFHQMSHAYHTAGKHSGEGHIYIGFEGENFSDEMFEHAITAELGHHLLRTVVPDADHGVSELYDFSLSWWAMDALNDYFDHGCMKLRLCDLFVERPDWDKGNYKLAEAAVDDILSKEAGREELLSYFFGENYLDHFIAMETLPTPKNVKTELAGIVFRQFGQMAYDPNHTTGWALAWKLLQGIEKHTGKEAKGIEAHNLLTDVTVKALYDESIDFTSPEQYIETLVPKLPEYLNDE